MEGRLLKKMTITICKLPVTNITTVQVSRPIQSINHPMRMLPVIPKEQITLQTMEGSGEYVDVMGIRAQTTNSRKDFCHFVLVIG